MPPGLKLWDVTFTESRRRTVTLAAASADDAKRRVLDAHGEQLDEMIADRRVCETAYCALQVEVERVERAPDALGGTLAYEGIEHARRAT